MTCQHYRTGAGHCGAGTGVRLYPVGPRCPAHTPAAIAGDPECPAYPSYRRQHATDRYSTETTR